MYFSSSGVCLVNVLKSQSSVNLRNCLRNKCFNTSADSSPMYLFEVFVGNVARFLPFIVRIAFYVVVACGVAVLLMFHPFLLFMILILATSISILRETLRQTRVTSVQEVQIAGHLLFFLSTIFFSVIGFWYTSISVSRILAISFTCSLLGLNINHNIFFAIYDILWYICLPYVFYIFFILVRLCRASRTSV